jgi:hypothetical protein
MCYIQCIYIHTNLLVCRHLRFVVWTLLSVEFAFRWKLRREGLHRRGEVRGGEAGLRLRGHLHLPVQGAVVMRHPPTRFFLPTFFIKRFILVPIYMPSRDLFFFRNN